MTRWSKSEVITEILLWFMTFALCALIIWANAAEAHQFRTEMRVSRVDMVYDGDTAVVTIDGLPNIFGSLLLVRIRGIDAPEVRISTSFSDEKRACLKRMAQASKDELAEFLMGPGKRVVLISPTRGKYFRIIADIEVNGVSAAQHMLHEGQARKYDGGKRKPWECSE